MIKAIIIDDEVNARETLKVMLEMYVPQIEIIAQAEGVKDGLQVIKENKPDLVFLDIQMGDGSGFDLLDNLSTYDFKIIFVTAYEEYAIKAFKFSALDYLIKPLIPDDLIQAVNKMKNSRFGEVRQSQLDVYEKSYNKSSQSNGKIILKTTEAIHLVEIQDIIHCQSENNYTFVYLKGEQTIMVSRTLKEFDKLLADVGFLRVHHSHLINISLINHFDKREGGAVVMKEGSKIPVSSRRKEQLLRLMQNLGRQL